MKIEYTGESELIFPSLSPFCAQPIKPGCIVDVPDDFEFDHTSLSTVKVTKKGTTPADKETN